jgi:hypothetical protein
MFRPRSGAGRYSCSQGIPFGKRRLAENPLLILGGDEARQGFGGGNGRVNHEGANGHDRPLLESQPLGRKILHHFSSGSSHLDGSYSNPNLKPSRPSHSHSNGPNAISEAARPRSDNTTRL